MGFVKLTVGALPRAAAFPLPPLVALLVLVVLFRASAFGLACLPALTLWLALLLSATLLPAFLPAALDFFFALSPCFISSPQAEHGTLVKSLSQWRLRAHFGLTQA